MKTTKAVLAMAISVTVTLGVAAAEAGKHPGEKVDVKSLPASVQNTIKQKAAGGQVVKVLREDDPDRKWNYEVVVKANGKDSMFEVDPNGNFVKQHEYSQHYHVTIQLFSRSCECLGSGIAFRQGPRNVHARAGAVGRSVTYAPPVRPRARYSSFRNSALRRPLLQEAEFFLTA